MDKKQCKALKLNKEQCTRFANKGSEYCWQHQFSRLSDARWYNNTKTHALVSILVAVIFVHSTAFGPTKDNQRELSLAQSLASQADIAHTNLNYQKAIDLYQKALDTLPQDQQATRATYLNNLGFLYNTTANYKKAEPLMRQALAIDEKSFGQDHPEVARNLNNLAMLLQDTNPLAEAESLIRRAVAIYEKSFGPEHPSVATSLNNLAWLLKTTNRFAEAEPMYRRALKILEKSLGAEHPNTKITKKNLESLIESRK